MAVPACINIYVEALHTKESSLFPELPQLSYTDEVKVYL